LAKVDKELAVSYRDRGRVQAKSRQMINSNIFLLFPLNGSGEKAKI
jgi:hypothetical protein